jgi:hypothetical protein
MVKLRILNLTNFKINNVEVILLKLLIYGVTTIRSKFIPKIVLLYVKETLNLDSKFDA